MNMLGSLQTRKLLLAGGFAGALFMALVPLPLIAGLPAAAIGNKDDGQAKATPPAKKEVPLGFNNSNPERPKAGGVLLAGSESGKHWAPYMLTADASCHHPCDDSFKLKAWVQDTSGRGMKGITVAFSFKLESGLTVTEVKTDSSGYAHLHLKLTPSVAPQDVRVDVTVQCNQGDATGRAITWFTPNYN